MQLKRTVLTDILFLLLSSMLCHVLLSKYGFNPTDEGFVLSSSNRLLHGQIPHLDFSSLRPLGYAFIHIPELLLSKDYFFLISRFVFWLENLCIAYLWVRWLERMTIPLKNDSAVFIDGKLKWSFFYGLVFCTFLLNIHYFPCSVLHTIDGLLFIMLGLNLITSKKKYSSLGFLFIGYAALCKQNYVILIPATLLLIKQKNYILNSFMGILPIAIYVAIISYYGGWTDLSLQLSSHHELFEVGIKEYLLHSFFLPGIALGVLCNRLKINSILYIGFILALLVALLITEHYHGSMSFLFVGLLISEFIQTKKRPTQTLWVCLILMWSVSISVGYNTPALFLGSYFSLMIIIKILDESIKTKFWLAGCLLIITASFYARTQHIYRDAPIQKLTYKLDGVVQGANGIYTNKNTYDVLIELDSLKEINPALVVLPDFTASNILHNQDGPLLTEWHNGAEIPTEPILNKVINKLIQLKDVRIAVPKYQTALLKDGFKPLENGGMNYLILQYVKKHYKKDKESQYFDVYKTP